MTCILCLQQRSCELISGFVQSLRLLILNFYYETFFFKFHSILFKFQLKNETKKRKITEEGRLFNKKWTDEYFFIEANTKAICLILNKEKYSTLLFQLIQEFEKRFQDFRQNHQ